MPNARARGQTHPMQTTPGRDERMRWSRRPDHRWVAGVASGIADHAAVPVWVVRVAFVATTPLAGLGAIVYAFLWWLLPRADLPESAARRTARRFPQAPIWFGVGLVAFGALLFAGQAGWLNRSLVVALGLIALGALLFLREPAPESRTSAPNLGPGSPPGMPTPPVPGQETDLPPASLPASTRPTGWTRRHRERSFLGPLTLGAGLVVIALATLLDLAGAVTFAVADAAALLLLILGAGLAVGGFVGRARWLVLPVMLVAPFALVLTVLHIDLDDGIGDRTVAIRSFDGSVERRLAGGEMTVDLMGLREGESGTLRVHVGAGMLTLNIPDDITVELTGSVGLGTTQILHSRISRSNVHRCCREARARGGFAQPIWWMSGSREGSTPGVVSIHATVSIGAVRINHVDRSSAR